MAHADIERLRLPGTVAPCGRITNVSDSNIAPQLEHVILLEDIPHQAAALADATQLAIPVGGDAGRVLAPDAAVQSVHHRDR